MAASTIKTYNTESFQESYIQPNERVNELMKPDFGTIPFCQFHLFLSVRKMQKKVG